MTPTTIGIIGLAFLFIFLILRMPVAIAMLVVGFIGTSFDQETSRDRLKNAGADKIITDLLEILPLIQ